MNGTNRRLGNITALAWFRTPSRQTHRAFDRRTKSTARRMAYALLTEALEPRAMMAVTGAVTTTAPAPSPAVLSTTVVAAPTATVTVAPVSFAVTSDWGSGFNGNVTVRNTSGAASAGWTVAFDFDGQITTLWSGVIASQSGSHYTVRNEAWNGALAANASTTFGFTATPGGSAAVLRNLTLVGSGTPTPTPTPLPGITVSDASVSEGNPQAAVANGYLHTSGSQILDANGNAVRIA
ncbi:MAG: cellulose binding domain-containing protein, partial [Pirellulales bacterium]